MYRILFAALALLPAAATAEVPRVATDIAPVQSLVARVMEGLGQPDTVIPPGASPHGYAMRPSQAAALQDAGLVVWVGEALTPWLARPVETLAGGRTLELLSVDGTALLEWPGDEEHGGHEDEHGEVDPHAWLDPDNGRLWLDAVAGALATLDPQNADAYRANAAAGRAEIDAAEADAEAALAPHRDAPFVVYHDAYRYFARHFGLPEATPLALSDAAAPPPARVAETAARVRQNGVHCVFSEPQFSPSLIATVTEGTGARVAILDPLGSDLAAGPSLYPELVRSLARTIADCAGG